MAISDDTIALAIPSALKSDHPDSALVVQALAVALAACEDSGGLNAKARMRDVHAALSSVYVPIFAAHIAKEDEDWNALKAKADRYVPTITVEWVNSGKGRKSYRLSGEREGTATAYRDTDGLWSTAVYFRGDDAPAESDASLARESGDSVRKALESLGYVVAWKAQEPADKATPASPIVGRLRFEWNGEDYGPFDTLDAAREKANYIASLGSRTGTIKVTDDAGNVHYKADSVLS